MKTRILNVLLLPILFLLSITFSNAQIASSEVLTAKGNDQYPSSQKVNSLEEEMGERIERGDLLTPIGSSAYDIYNVYVDSDVSDQSMKRKLKRSLVAALVDASDRALIEYFDEGGVFILQYMSPTSGKKRIVPLDQYYFVAADLLGKDNYLYGSLRSKGYFIEALKFRYIEKQGLKTVIKKLKETIALDTEASYTYNELGLIYSEEENYSMACENYNLAIKLNSDWKIPKENLKMAEAAMLGSKNKK